MRMHQSNGYHCSETTGTMPCMSSIEDGQGRRIELCLHTHSMKNAFY